MLTPEGAIEEEEDILVFDFPEVLEERPTKFHAIACYYSNKNYNTPGMFWDMRHAWGVTRGF